MKEFIEITHVGKRGEEFRNIVAVSRIISFTEIGGKIFIQLGQSKGKTRIGYRVKETYEEILRKLSEAQK